MSIRLPYKPEIGEIIPAEWYWDVVDSITFLYTKYNEIKRETDCIEKELNIANMYLNNILKNVKRPNKIKSIIKTVTENPEPLTDQEMKTYRVIIKSAGYVYIADRESAQNKQGFLLNPNEKIELDITNPQLIYVYAIDRSQIFLIFEIVDETS